MPFNSSINFSFFQKYLENIGIARPHGAKIVELKQGENQPVEFTREFPGWDPVLQKVSFSFLAFFISR